MKREFIMAENFEKQLAMFHEPENLLLDIEQEVFIDLEKNISNRDVIAGTGGFTKLRVPLRSEGRGKSGSARVIYLDSEKTELTFLFMIYSKAKKDSISQEVKNFLKIKAKEFKQWRPKKN